MSENNIIILDVGSGDCKYVKSILSEEEKLIMFDNVKNEINWDKMSHKGGDVTRLINVQSLLYFDDSGYKMPLYRHPVDDQPKQNEFSPYVKLLKDRAEDILGLERDYFNHCLCQFYPNGESHISDHSDKTLDVKQDSVIINISLGAVRYMKIKDKNKNEKGERSSSRIKLDNGSIFVLGLKTNREYYHGINPDNRHPSSKSPDELAFNSERISLTFRNIVTFIDQNGKISGQGAIKIFDQGAIKIFDQGENKNDNINELSDYDDALNMIKAFSKENNEKDFDWNSNYGCGFKSIGVHLLN
jgi:alkylated DNA repair dioxygenase AlkB